MSYENPTDFEKGIILPGGRITPASLLGAWDVRNLGSDAQTEK